MEQKALSEKLLRKRKFLMVFPLIVLPFTTLLFWALGGGRVNPASAQQGQKGLNMQLPGANIKDDKPFDKLSYYEKAAADSMKLQQLIEKDPYYLQKADTTSLLDMGNMLSGIEYNSNSRLDKRSAGNYGLTYNDPNEIKVNRKLAELNAALNRASVSETNTNNELNKMAPAGKSIEANEMERLEQMMQVVNQKEGDDPEIQQLNGILEKVLDIQNPDRTRERLKRTSEATKGQVFAVAVEKENNFVSLLQNNGSKNRKDSSPGTLSYSNGFYSIDDTTELNDTQSAIQAVIHQTQTLVNGSTVKLRLVNDVYINGKLIPKDNFVFGTATLDAERLSIKINSIRYKNSLFSVELSTYDLDGMDGIYVPGSITSDVAKQSADRAAQQLSISTLDPSIGAQAASAGIEAARSLFGRKVKLVKVTVKAGYRVFLKNVKE